MTTPAIDQPMFDALEVAHRISREFNSSVLYQYSKAEYSRRVATCEEIIRLAVFAAHGNCVLRREEEAFRKIAYLAGTYLEDLTETETKANA